MMGLAGSMLFTIAHSSEETFLGRDAPLWEAFGYIARVEIPAWIGFVLFTLGLVVALTIVSALAYAGSEWWLGVLVGARLGDCVFSHWLPTVLGHDVPGNWTTPLYVAEACVGLATGPSVLGIVVGAGAFAAILPGLRLIGILIEGRTA